MSRDILNRVQSIRAIVRGLDQHGDMPPQDAADIILELDEIERLAAPRKLEGVRFRDLPKWKAGQDAKKQ